MITAVTADSDEAKRVASASSDKYKIYEALSNSLTGEDQLAKSYGATFTFNQAAKKLTVSGNMLLPINPDEAATKGKVVILVAAMYKYDSSTSKFKAKLFGQSEKITPEKAGTNEVAFAAKKLNVVDTPVVLFEENMVATGYYTGSKKHSIYNSEGGKLIRRNLLLKVFENIPYSECNFAEDYLISFFITQFAQTYVGIEAPVYRYRISSGVSSSRKIDSLDKWKMVCSTSSVFTVIAQWIQENHEESKITQEEEGFIRRKTAIYLANNLKQMNETVIPELQPAARQMLCEYWGEHFMQTVESTFC